MAGGTNTLAFAIKAQNEASAVLKAVQADVENLGKSADDHSGKVGKFSGALGDMAKVAGGFAIGSGLLALPGLLGGMASAAAEDEQATARLNQTLKNLGGDVDGNTKKINDRISAGQKLAFTDDDVRDSFEFLANATGDADEALRRQTIAMDLARGANIPLATAAKMLGKVNDENIQGFKKLGITINDGATEADALAAVQGKFAGQSEAYAKSTAGQFEIMKIRIAEAKETIGAALLPVMNTLGTVLATVVVPAVEKFAVALGPSLGATFGAFAAVARTLEPVWAPMAAGIAAVAAVILGSMIPAGIAWIAVEYAKVAAFLASAAAFVVANAPLIGIALVIGLVVAAVVLLIQHWDDITAKFPILGTIADGVKAVLEGFAGWITGTLVPAVMSIASTVTDAVGQAIGFVRDNWPLLLAIILGPIGLIVDAIILNWGTIKDTVTGAVSFVVGFVQDHWPQIQTVIETLTSWITGTFSVVFGAIKGYVIDPVTAAIGFIVDHWPEIQGAIQGVLDFISNVFSVGFGAITDYVINPIEAAINWVVNNIGRILGPIQSIIDKAQEAIGWVNKIPNPGDLFGGAGDIQHARDMGRYTGDANWMGGMALVGERGPELAILPGGTTIIPNHLLAQLPHFANGGVTGPATARDWANMPAYATHNLFTPYWHQDAAGNWFFDYGEHTGAVEAWYATQHDPKTGKPNVKPAGMSQYVYDNWEMFFPDPSAPARDPGHDTYTTYDHTGWSQDNNDYAMWLASQGGGPVINRSGTSVRTGRGGGRATPAPPSAPPTGDPYGRSPVYGPANGSSAPYNTSGAGSGITIVVNAPNAMVVDGRAMRDAMRAATPVLQDELDRYNRGRGR